MAEAIGPGALTSRVRCWRLVVLTAIAAVAAATVGATVGHSSSVRLRRRARRSVTPWARISPRPTSGRSWSRTTTAGCSPSGSRSQAIRYLTEDLRIRVWLDTDANPETGLRGADRYLLPRPLGARPRRGRALRLRQKHVQRRQDAADESPGRLFVSPTGTGRRSPSRRLTWASWGRSASCSGSRPGAASASIRSPGATTSRTRDRTSLPTVRRGGWAIRAPRGRRTPGSTTRARYTRAASRRSRRGPGQASSSACGWLRSPPTPERPVTSGTASCSMRIAGKPLAAHVEERSPAAPPSARFDPGGHEGQRVHEHDRAAVAGRDAASHGLRPSRLATRRPLGSRP